MQVFRIAKRKYAQDLTGEGARLFGGRWNKKLIPCIYTSESRSLAILEYSVNVNIDDIPRALCMLTIDLSGHSIYEVKEPDLPGNWKSHPSPEETRNFGTKLLLDPEIEVIKIPSTVIPEEFNYILNPTHLKGKIKISAIQDFFYDIRLKTV